ncbi:MAG: DUF333 domain-containing protein [Patescibacteria group bacterium]
MKKTLVALSLLLLAGCSVGGVALTKPAVSCESDGLTFAPGEEIQLADGCNTCLCGADGAVGNCTNKDCSQLSELANPAAVKCSVDGFKNEIRTAADGSQSGICIDANGKECDDWAYFRGECALGAAASLDENLNAEIPAAVEDKNASTEKAPSNESAPETAPAESDS